MPRTTLQLPDITPVQWKSTIGVVVVLLTVVFKLNISEAEQGVILGVVTSLWGTAMVIADAITRHGRAKIAVAEVNASRVVDPGPMDAPGESLNLADDHVDRA